MKFPAFLLAFGPVLAAVSTAEAGEVAPPGSKPLSVIINAIEGQRLGVVTSAEFDDGWWEVKVCNAPTTCQKLYIDPKSGEEKRRRNAGSDDGMPSANAKPLSAIVQAIEARETGTITEVDFDRGFWEVELRRDGRRVRVDIDPRTGETRR